MFDKRVELYDPDNVGNKFQPALEEQLVDLRLGDMSQDMPEWAGS